ncbi:MAG TPA: hypothetical protein VNC50_21845 [Planctomycetia bacterium]|nr:hypothetical protein [Planctomycetia bacterium]
MASPRRDIVTDGKVGFYHCTVRCVRNAYLGETPGAKGNDPRKTWIRDRIAALAEHFAVEVGAFAILDDHLHAILRVRPDVASTWSAAEVERRWRSVFIFKPRTDAEKRAIPGQMRTEAADAKLVKLRRDRLSTVSWFMRSLAEPIARRANKFDGQSGRFWQGRFEVRALLDDAALLMGTTFVDLSPAFGGIASPTGGKISAVGGKAVPADGAPFTSLRERAAGRKETSDAKRRDGWLAPFVGAKSKGKSGRRLTDEPWLPLVADDYFKLIAWAAKDVVAKKRTPPPAEVAARIAEFNLDPVHFAATVIGFMDFFPRAAGSPRNMDKFARIDGRRFMHGKRASDLVYVKK